MRLSLINKISNEKFRGWYMNAIIALGLAWIAALVTMPGWFQLMPEYMADWLPLSVLAVTMIVMVLSGDVAADILGVEI